MITLLLQMLKKSIKIRTLVSVRDKMATFSRIILPIILVLISVVIIKIADIEYNPPQTSLVLRADSVYQGYHGNFAILQPHGMTDDYH